MMDPSCSIFLLALEMWQKNWLVMLNCFTLLIDVHIVVCAWWYLVEIGMILFVTSCLSIHHILASSSCYSSLITFGFSNILYFISLISLDKFDIYFLQLSSRECFKIVWIFSCMFFGSIYDSSSERGQVIKRVKVHVESAEDVWALKFINFIIGANQLLSDGLTRELPL